MYYLYKKEKGMPILYPNNSTFLQDCDLKIFHPHILRLEAPYEKIELKTKVSRLQFLLQTGGRFRIYHLCIGDKVIHTATVVPKCKKFKFMQKNDYEIGPCITDSNYRGKGAYRFTLSKIMESNDIGNNTLYMIVRDTNIASIKGIESVGFIRAGIVKRKGLFKNYYLER